MFNTKQTSQENRETNEKAGKPLPLKKKDKILAQNKTGKDPSTQGEKAQYNIRHTPPSRTQMKMNIRLQYLLGSLSAVFTSPMSCLHLMPHTSLYSNDHDICKLGQCEL